MNTFLEGSSKQEPGSSAVTAPRSASRSLFPVSWSLVSAVLAVALVLVWANDASAQMRHGRFIGPRAYFYSPFYYDPFWGPYPYAYGGYPIAVSRPRADVKVEVTPKQAEVYVDGFYAGVADDFDGAFKRLHVTPGGHAISLHLAGYRTKTENIYAAPGSTVKLRAEMQPLAAGETSDYPPLPAYTQTP